MSFPSNGKQLLLRNCLRHNLPFPPPLPPPPHSQVEIIFRCMFLHANATSKKLAMLRRRLVFAVCAVTGKNWHILFIVFCLCFWCLGRWCKLGFSWPALETFILSSWTFRFMSPWKCFASYREFFLASSLSVTDVRSTWLPIDNRRPGTNQS